MTLQRRGRGDAAAAREDGLETAGRRDCAHSANAVSISHVNALRDCHSVVPPTVPVPPGKNPSIGLKKLECGSQQRIDGMVYGSSPKVPVGTCVDVNQRAREWADHDADRPWGT